tara:strand:- start:19001 stop:19711 length:711 start_codon:yes stop_codon:yes gene_type:complete
MASKEAAVVGNTALDILEDNVERQEEFEKSPLGQALYYGTAMLQGSRIGGAIDKTLGITDYFKDRKAYKESDEGAALYGDRKAFREGFRKYQQRARQTVRSAEPGEMMYDMYGNEMFERTNKPFMDKRKVRAYYLNNLKDYKYNPESDSTEQLTPRVRVNKITLPEALQPIDTQYMNPSPVVNYQTQGMDMQDVDNITSVDQYGAINVDTTSLYQGMLNNYSGLSPLPQVSIKENK